MAQRKVKDVELAEEMGAALAHPVLHRPADRQHAGDRHRRHRPGAGGAICRIARHALGKGLVRVGRAPKFALFYRTDDRSSRAPCSSRSPAGARGRGQSRPHQDHRDRPALEDPQPYAWPDGSPLDVRRDRLPEINEAAVERFLDAVTALVTSRGGEVHHRSRGARAGPARPRQPMTPESAPARSPTRSPGSTTPAPASATTSGSASASRSSGSYGEEGGEPLWLWWSEQSDKFDLGTPSTSGSTSPRRPRQPPARSSTSPSMDGTT